VKGLSETLIYVNGAVSTQPHDRLVVSEEVPQGLVIKRAVVLLLCSPMGSGECDSKSWAQGGATVTDSSSLAPLRGSDVIKLKVA
jgi:hypothetical protein